MKQAIKRMLRQVGNAMLADNHQKLDVSSRTGAAAKAAQVAYVAHLQGLARANKQLPRLQDCGFRVFSQFEEDGYLLYLAAVLEITPKLFIDIGAADGINSNLANLALNHGWHGLFLEGNAERVKTGKAFYGRHSDSELYPPKFRQAIITRENINALIESEGFSGPVGIVSIDIDGNDYYVWEALQVVQPSVVIIETTTEFGSNNIVFPYDPKYMYPGRHPMYRGASPVAMAKLAQRKGYRLVGANRFGFNLIFVKRGIFDDRVPETALDEVLRHPRYREGLALFEPVKDFPFVTPDP